MLKIIGLNGSPRGSQSRTRQLIEQVLDYTRSNGAETEFYDIAKLDVKPCIACDRCHKIGSCFQKDDYQRIIDGILSADGIVIGSPVYNYQVTAQLKTWLDRLGMIIHCQMFSGKYGVVVTTSGGAGETETADYLDFAVRRTGAQCVGRLASGIENDGLLEKGSPLFDEANKLGRQLMDAIKEKKVFPRQVEEQEQLKGFFAYMIGQRKEKWEWEYNYWQQKGWL